MCPPVLLHLSNKLRKSNKTPGLPTTLLLLCNKFTYLNNTGAQMLDSIDHMA